jgi:hypothetical protein
VYHLPQMILPKLQSAYFHDHKHLPALKPSASHCPMCKMLLTGLEKAWVVEFQEMDKELGGFGEDEDEYEKKVMVSIEVPFPGGYLGRRPKIELQEGKALYYCLAGVHIPIPLIQIYVDLQLAGPESGKLHENEKGGRSERIAKLRNLLDQDVMRMANEASSSQSSSGASSSAPTRVLVVGTSQVNIEGSIRLVETSSLESELTDTNRLQWVAPSHRWGTLPQFDTTALLSKLSRRPSRTP